MNKNLLWIMFSIVTIFSLWFSYNYFEKAIPFVNISIAMSKQEAERFACQLAEQYSWDVQGFDTAVHFKEDPNLQAFVELEGGGKQAYIDMIKQGYYQPYTWQVRFYKEYEISEAVVYFTPDGKKYGFTQKIPEDRVGKDLTKLKAQKIAEDGAKSWDIDLAPYKLIEHEQHTRPSSRIDHSFVYERTDRTIGKGLYRLSIVVSGDKVTGIQYFVKVPNEFTRRYAQMFSQNKLIAMVSNSILMFLYIFIIGLFGLLFLYRKHYLCTSVFLKLMTIFGVLLLLAALNNLPLVWYSYPTNISKNIFILQQIGMMVIGTLLFTLFITFVCLVAEGLGRYVFGRHVQFLKLWSTDVAGSYTIAEQTIIGYCGAIIMLAYMLAFYIVANSWGWWCPLFTKIDPNILSSYIPFFSPFIKGALQAAFVEEFLTRALPIAGILFLVRNFQYKKYWFLGMCVFQAILFGALHATYPMQPAYYRIVEIFIPALGFGWMYYTFGLLPGIITHAVYDIIFFEMPIFVSNAWIQKILAVFVTGIPLWIVLYNMIRQGELKILSKNAYNDAWKPTEQELIEKQFARTVSSKTIPIFIQKYTWVFGAIGLLLFAFSKEFKFVTPQITINKQQAEQVAQQSIQERFGSIGSDWTVVTSFLNTVQNMENKFVWQTYGIQVYQGLQGSYVVPPHYSVRYIKFDGPVEDRAEEYGVWIGADGALLNVWHKLPEGIKGADISDIKAQDIAYNFIKKEYGLDKKETELVSCESKKHEFRRDWNIVVRDLVGYTFEKGQARIKITILGDELAGGHKFIYVPEEWQRTEQQRLVKAGVLSAVSYWLMVLLLLCFVIISYRFVGLSKLLFQVSGVVSSGIFLLYVLDFANNWKNLLFMLSTSEPYINQITTIFTSSIVSWVGSSCFMGMLIALTYLSGIKGIVKNYYQTIVTGIMIGCGVMGIYASIAKFEPQFVAQAPLYDFINYQSSIFSMVSYMLSASIWLYIIISAVRIVSIYIRSEMMQLLVFILAGISATGMAGATHTLWYWMFFSIVWGIVWYLLHRYVFAYNSDLLFVTVVTIQILRLAPVGVYQAYPTALLGVVVTGCIMLLGAVYVFRRQ